MKHAGSHKREEGFTLILVIALLLVASMITVTLIQKSERDQRWNPKIGMEAQLRRIASVIVAYEQINHRLPCVAPRTADANDPAFGKEIANCAAGGAATGGTARIAGPDGNFIRIGALPFRTLQFPESNGMDGWGNKITYAVSEAATGGAGAGNIVIRDKDGNVVTEEAGFVVLTHGANAQGAYAMRSGQLTGACTSGKDQINCSDGGAFQIAEFSAEADANAYDDQLIWMPAGKYNPCLPCATAAIGTVMEDGSICAGMQPHASQPICVADIDSPDRMTWGSHGERRYTEDTLDGRPNTETLAAFGQAAHPAAHYCSELVAHEQDDWYLPAELEMLALLTNRALIPSLKENDVYWSSTERSGNHSIYCLNDNCGHSIKHHLKWVRCVRR